MALTKVQGGMVGNGGIATLDGIQFPATQVPSADANCLDDYEEGTFTPVVGGTITNPTVTYVPANTVGFYTKIGNIVNFTLEVRTTAKSGGSGELIIGNLPFTVGFTSSYNVEAPVSLYNITFNSSASITAETFGGINYFYVRQSISGSTSTNLQISDWTNTSPNLIRITGQYAV